MCHITADAHFISSVMVLLWLTVKNFKDNNHIYSKAGLFHPTMKNFNVISIGKFFH